MTLSHKVHLADGKIVDVIGVLHARTDSDGKAELPILPGTVSVSISFHAPGGTGSYQDRIRSVQRIIERELDLAPGEVFDFGTVNVDGNVIQ